MQTYQLFQQLGASISKVENAYKKWSEKENLNLCTLKIYYTLSTIESMTQKQFSEAFNIPKTSVNKVITELKNNHSIYLNTNNKDKRSKIITLTEEGKECALSTLQPLFEIEEQVKRKFGEERLEQLVNLLENFSECLDKEMEDTKTKNPILKG